MNRTRAFAAVLGVLLSLSATSCLQPPSKTDDNGPEVPANEIQKALKDAWGTAYFSSVLQDEYLYIEQDQKISTLDPRVVYKEATQVTGREIVGDDVKYTMLIRSTSLENGSFKPPTSAEDEITVANSEPASVEPSTVTTSGRMPASVEELQKSMADGTVGVFSGESRNHFLGVQTMNNMLRACVKSEGWDVTCHNLQVTEGLRSAPTGVASQPDCGGIPNCQIRYKKVSFELVANLTDEQGANPHTEKVIYDMTLSPDVPYLSRLVEFCFQGMIPAGGQKVLIKICNRVQNFERGH